MKLLATACAVVPPRIVFVVEDDLEIAGLLAYSLGCAGFDVRVFCSTPQVISEAERVLPHAFLLDVMLPGGSGLTLCRQIRQHEALASTPVLFVTAKSAAQDRDAGFAAGANDYVVKPFSPRDLIARLTAVLDRPRAALSHFQQSTQ